MKNKETTRLRAECISRAGGDVLEVGIGSRLNLPFYSSDVTHIYGVDPSLELQRMARKKHVAEPVKVDFLTQPAEDPLPLANASIAGTRARCTCKLSAASLETARSAAWSLSRVELLGTARYDLKRATMRYLPTLKPT